MTPPRFEDRLEQELLAAARRRARTPGAAGRRRAWPAGRTGRRPAVGPALATAGALAALVALAALFVAVPLRDRGDADRAAAPGRPPSACEELLAREGTTLTDDPVDPRLLRRYGVLRRPQSARDRAACPVMFARGRVNPEAIRFARRNPTGDPIYLIPQEDTGDGSIRPRGSFLCAVTVFARGAGGGCSRVDDVVRTPLGITGSTGRAAFGLVPDGAATLRIALRDGSHQDAAVVGNLWTYVEDRRRRATAVASVTLHDRDGRVLHRVRGGRLRAFEPAADLPRWP